MFGKGETIHSRNGKKIVSKSMFFSKKKIVLSQNGIIQIHLCIFIDFSSVESFDTYNFLFICWLIHHAFFLLN